jgi:hypothetical protein
MDVPVCVNHDPCSPLCKLFITTQSDDATCVGDVCAPDAVQVGDLELH